MRFLAKVQESRFFLGILFLAFGLSILRQMPYEYIDHDVIIYTLIGKGIFQYGEMPYHFAFDHKPILTYLFYGPLAWLDGLGLNRFALLTAVFLCLMSLAVSRLALSSRVPFIFILLLFVAAAYRNIGYSGNTEIIFVFFEILSVLILLNFSKSNFYLALSAACAAISFNINYISAISIIPTIIYCLYVTASSPYNFVIRTIYFGLFGLAFIALIFIVMTLAGGDVLSYLDLQQRFLRGYSEGAAPITRRFVFIWSLAVAMVVISVIPALKLPRPDFHKWMAMVLLIIFSSASIALNDKFYFHYLFTVTAPAVAMILCLNYNATWKKSILAVANLFFAIVFIDGFVSFYFINTPNVPKLSDFYKELSEEVSQKKVMSIKTSVVPIYFSGAVPFQPLVWSDHAGFIYGKGEDDYYLSVLDRNPQFVLTDFDFCSNSAQETSICRVLAARYERIQSHSPPANAYFPGYDLFKMKSAL